MIATSVQWLKTHAKGSLQSWILLIQLSKFLRNEKKILKAEQVQIQLPEGFST